MYICICIIAQLKIVKPKITNIIESFTYIYRSLSNINEYPFRIKTLLLR